MCTNCENASQDKSNHTKDQSEKGTHSHRIAQAKGERKTMLSTSNSPTGMRPTGEVYRSFKPSEGQVRARRATVPM